MFLNISHHVVEVMFVLVMQLLALTVVHSSVHHSRVGGHGRKKHDIDKGNLDGPDNCISLKVYF